MKIFLAANSGFCFGVCRAIEMALEASKSGETVYTMGELIHNPQFIQELSERGIKVLDDISSAHKKTVIIRSHGITKEEHERLIAQGNKIIDATCPYVRRTHELIKGAVKDDYELLILGDENHPEVIGMLSYGNSQTKVIAPGESPKDLKRNRICLVSQTTQKIDNLKALVGELLPKTLELKVYNSICLATTQRQNASAALAKQSDLMVVIGGYQSSNTKMLASLCSNYCQTIHIETEEELDAKLFASKKRIGLAAGASTPEERIIKVYNEILKINGEDNLVTSIQRIPLFKEESC